MLLVTYVCSDPDCAQEQQALVEGLSELEGLCDCGYGLVILDVAEAELV